MKIAFRKLKKLLESVADERVLATAALNGDNESLQVLQDAWEQTGFPLGNVDKFTLLNNVLNSAGRNDVLIYDESESTSRVCFKDLPVETDCKSCTWASKSSWIDATVTNINLRHSDVNKVEFGYLSILDDGYTTVYDDNAPLFIIDPTWVVVSIRNYTDDETGEIRQAISADDTDEIVLRVKEAFERCNEYVNGFFDGVERGLEMKFR